VTISRGVLWASFFNSMTHNVKLLLKLRCSASRVENGSRRSRPDPLVQCPYCRVPVSRVKRLQRVKLRQTARNVDLYLGKSFSGQWQRMLTRRSLESKVAW
jgi:hypothetical protein